MGATAKIIIRPCGFTLQGGNDDEVVAAAQSHAREAHGLAELDEPTAAAVATAIHPVA